MASLNVYYQNTRGLRTKTHTFKRNLFLNSYDVIGISETWLLDGINNEELFDNRYLVWRRDRDYTATRQKYGGGVLLAVRRELAVVERPDWSSSAEDIWITITLKNSSSYNFTKIHFCCLYLCSESLGNSFLTQLNNFTDKLSFLVNNYPNDMFIILGDFNFSNVDWIPDHTTFPQPIGISGDSQIYFFDTLLQCNLNQYNLCRNINNTILDYVLCNYDVNVAACGDPLVPEDVHHKSIVVSVPLSCQDYLKVNPRVKYYYESADYDKIRAELLNTDWSICLSENTLEYALDHFYSILYDVRDKHVPQKLIYPSSFPPWYSSSLKKLLKEKYKFLCKYHTYNNTCDYKTFSLLRNRAKEIEAECYNLYIKRIEDSILKNPKLFWSYHKSAYKSSSALPSTMDYDGQSADTGEAISDLFATYFQSTFLSSSRTHNLNVPNSIEYNNNISDIELNPEEIRRLLANLDLNKGPGPDNIVPIFISKCADCLTTPLIILFKRSLSEGYVPKIWKSAFITPVHKSGSKKDVKNFRPISKLCIFAKIFERVVYSQVYSTLSSTFIPEQHGFLKKKSTSSNLISFIEFTTSSMDSGGQVDSIFTDYSKAFDRIDHKILLDKLLNAGIHGNLFRWFTSYIENRSQAVVVNGFTSSWRIVPSGVPQGSLLGPLLFIIFVNDIATCFKYSRFLLYADDMKVFKLITNEEDSRLLQDDLNGFENYCDVNHLELNVSKCYSMTFTRKPKPIHFNYSLKSIHIKKVNKIRDLGIIHDSKLLYDEHIDHIVKKSNRAMGLIMRTGSQFTCVKVLKILYCSFVRSILEYCSEVWNPQYDKYVNRIELIQKRFMRFLQFKCERYDNSYEARCKRHHILPLHLRRNIADIVFLSKIAQNKINDPLLLSLINIKVPSKLSIRKPISLSTPEFKTNYRQNSFFIRAPSMFNELVQYPDLDLFNTSLYKFKTFLSKLWFDNDVVPF